MSFPINFELTDSITDFLSQIGGLTVQGAASSCPAAPDLNPSHSQPSFLDAGTLTFRPAAKKIEADAFPS